MQTPVSETFTISSTPRISQPHTPFIADFKLDLGVAAILTLGAIAVTIATSIDQRKWEKQYLSGKA